MALTITNNGSAGGGFKKYVDVNGNLFINDVSFNETLNDNPWATIQVDHNSELLKISGQ